jgi:hypothetical protein
MRCGERRKSAWRSRRNGTAELAYQYVSELSVSAIHVLFADCAEVRVAIALQRVFPRSPVDVERCGCFGISCVSASDSSGTVRRNHDAARHD